MEMALRRRLAGVAEVRISQEKQTAEVRFAPGPHNFNAAEFRAAVGEAEVEVLRFEIDVCGHVEKDGGSTWFVAGPNRFDWPAPVPAPTAGRCVSAALDDRVAPGRIEPVVIQD